MASNFPSGFSNGVTVRGMPLQQAQPGEVFFVNNSTVVVKAGIGGSDNGPGTYQQPFKTLSGALASGRVMSGRGDVIFLMPNHAENISNATSLQFVKAGVAIVGLGGGASRATFTVDTASTSTIPVTAANVSIQNILFIANFAAIASVFTVTGTASAKNFCSDNCEFRDNSSILNFVAKIKGNATANSLDGLLYIRNKTFGLGTTAATTDVVVSVVNDRMELSDNTVVQPALNNTAVLAAFGSSGQTNLIVARNKVYRPSTSTTGGSLFSGSGSTFTGYVFDNYSWHLNAVAGLLAPVGTGLGFQNNYCMITGAADKSGLINPAAV